MLLQTQQVRLQCHVFDIEKFSTNRESNRMLIDTRKDLITVSVLKYLMSIVDIGHVQYNNIVRLALCIIYNDYELIIPFD